MEPKAKFVDDFIIIIRPIESQLPFLKGPLEVGFMCRLSISSTASKAINLKEFTTNQDKNKSLVIS